MISVRATIKKGKMMGGRGRYLTKQPRSRFIRLLIPTARLTAVFLQQPAVS